MSSHACCAILSTSRAYLLDADWCLHSDVVANARDLGLVSDVQKYEELVETMSVLEFDDEDISEALQLRHFSPQIISTVLLSSMPPHIRRVMCSTS